MLRVAVQERQRLRREGLAMVVAAEPDMELVGTASTGTEMVALCHDTPADVVVIEADPPDWDPAHLVRAIRQTNRQVRVVGTAATAASPTASRAARAGIQLLVPRSSGIQDVLGAVRGLPCAEVVPLARPAVEPAGSPLTKREIEVLRMIADGFPSREIALKLGITAKTVENHKQRVFAKLAVQNQSHAVAVAIRAGLLPSSSRRSASGW
ncbi:MAG: hypothetical protein QOG64_3245 [Acidimicrobiaceae bacterium]|nr:hypothetical protein [Acidimicrobiaceae bacterium]